MNTTQEEVLPAIAQEAKINTNLFKKILTPVNYKKFQEQTKNLLDDKASFIPLLRHGLGSTYESNNSYKKILYISNECGDFSTKAYEYDYRSKMKERFLNNHSPFKNYVSYMISLDKAFTIYLYSDFTCCGIQHFGNIGCDLYGRGLYKGELDQMICEIDDFILSKYVRSINDKIGILGIMLAYNNTKKPDIKELIKKGEQCLLGSEDRVFKLKATCALPKKDDMTFPMLNNQTIFHYILSNSKLFKKDSEFVNMNSGNTVYEFSVEISKNEIIRSFIEELKTHE